MKLTLQIAAALFLAGIITWVFWMGVFTAAVTSLPVKTLDIGHMIRDESHPNHNTGPNRAAPAATGRM